MALVPKYTPIKRVKPADPATLPDVPEELPDRYKLFAKEYLVDLNGTQAAIRSGYSPKGAARKACGLLKNPLIRAYIDECKKKILARAEIDDGKVIDELAAIAFINPRDFISWKDGVLTMQNSDDVPDAIMKAIQSIEETENKNGHKITIKFHSKLEAITLLMRHMGMLKEEVSLSGGDKPIRIDNSRVDDAREKILGLLSKKREVTETVGNKTIKTTTKATMSGAIPMPKSE